MVCHLVWIGGKKHAPPTHSNLICCAKDHAFKKLVTCFCLGYDDCKSNYICFEHMCFLKSDLVDKVVLKVCK